MVFTMQYFESLRQLSARIGQDRNLVQAGGGNTSIKIGDTLWVKASGKWLIHALEEEMFLPVPMSTSLRCIDEGHDCTEEFRTPSGQSLRPSVETTMHAVLPHSVVIHVHSVNTIAWAVRTDAMEMLRERLSGLRWEFIPYIHPGFPLARRIRELLSRRPDVLVLGNHGLVVAGEDCESAEMLLRDVERRLDIPPASAPAPDPHALRELAAGTGWAPAANSEVHSLGTNPLWAKIAAQGTMYPDHCVYLGPGAAVAEAGESIAQAVERYRARFHFEPVALLAAGRGVLVSERISQAAQELLICVKRVAERIDRAAHLVRYLDDRQVAGLMNWDAEKYRLALAREQTVINS